MTKYYGQNCLKNFLFHSTLSIMIQISEHGPILAQNKNKSIKKTHKQVSFLISIFELKQTSTFVLTENCWIWNFSATHLLDIFIACLRKVLKLRNIEVWRRLRQGMDKKMFLRTILGKIFGKQCRKSKKKPENLYICFWIIFLTATAKKNHFWRGGWALGSVPYQFWELPNIL